MNRKCVFTLSAISIALALVACGGGGDKETIAQKPVIDAGHDENHAGDNGHHGDQDHHVDEDHGNDDHQDPDKPVNNEKLEKWSWGSLEPDGQFSVSASPISVDAQGRLYMGAFLNGSYNLIRLDVASGEPKLGWALPVSHQDAAVTDAPVLDQANGDVYALADNSKRETQIMVANMEDGKRSKQYPLSVTIGGKSGPMTDAKIVLQKDSSILAQGFFDNRVAVRYRGRIDLVNRMAGVVLPGDGPWKSSESMPPLAHQDGSATLIVGGVEQVFSVNTGPDEIDLPEVKAQLKPMLENATRKTVPGTPVQDSNGRFYVLNQDMMGEPAMIRRAATGETPIVFQTIAECKNPNMAFDDRGTFGMLDDVLYVRCGTGLFAFDTSEPNASTGSRGVAKTGTGAALWSFHGVHADEAVTTTPTLTERGTAYVGTNQALYALDKSGKPQWHYTLKQANTEVEGVTVDQKGTVYLTVCPREEDLLTCSVVALEGDGSSLAVAKNGKSAVPKFGGDLANTGRTWSEAAEVQKDF